MRSTVVVGFFLATLISASAAGQVADPVPDIPVGNRAVNVELVVALPDSGSIVKPRARPMTLIGDGAGRRFIVDQNGPIYQLHPDGTLSVFLDVKAESDLRANQGQLGVSSAAFHPDYHVVGAAGEGRFYTASSQLENVPPDFPVPVGAPSRQHSVVHEWLVDPADPDAIDATSLREVLRIAQPYSDHNIGQIAFDPNLASPDPDYGLLYIAMGDGGNFGCCPRASVDPHFLGQDTSHPLGAILRIDPLDSGPLPYTVPASNVFASDGDAGTLGEIWAYGLRNPHRFSWDRGGTGRMLISDIGQSNVEEIVLGANGANFGWSEREGTFLVQHFNELDVFPLPPGDALLGFTYPVLQYDHDENDRAISGGSVYRDTAVPSIQGQYVFGDLASGRMFVADIDNLDGSGQAAMETLRLIDDATGLEQSLLELIGGGPPAPRADLRFGSDDAGGIYLLTKEDGSVRRVVAAAECTDGLDNDGDGLVDFPDDPGCGTASWTTESPECQDGLNNDGQVGTDFDGGESILGAGNGDPDGPDPDCKAFWDKKEATGCGLGFELALVVPLLWAWRSRRLTRRTAA